MSAGLLRSQIVAMRAGAKAIVAQAEAILTAMEPEALERQQPDAPCRHEPAKRMATPRMGAPDAWRCACGAEGDATGDDAMMLIERGSA